MAHVLRKPGQPRIGSTLKDCPQIPAVTRGKRDFSEPPNSNRHYFDDVRKFTKGCCTQTLESIQQTGELIRATPTFAHF